MKKISTFVNNSEFDQISQWAKQNGFVNEDGSVNIYRATKSAMLQVANGKAPNFAEPPSIVAAMEDRAKQIDAMTPKQAGSELESWYDSKKDRKNVVRTTLFGADVWDNTLALLYEKREDPTAAIFFITEFWNEMLLSRRRQGHSVSDVITEFINRHMETGDWRNNRKGTRSQGSLRLHELTERRTRNKGLTDRAEGAKGNMDRRTLR